MVDIIKMKKKVCLLGDEGVGKTSLIRRYVLDMFDDEYIATLGAKVSKKEIDLNFSKEVEKPVYANIKLSVWDILGQKDESTLRARPVYYRGTNGALIVCDITRKDTFKNIPEWIKSLDKVEYNLPLIIIGNKIDLYKEASVFYKDLEELGKKYNYPIFLTSAKTNSNVEKAFYTLTEMMIKKYFE